MRMLHERDCYLIAADQGDHKGRPYNGRASEAPSCHCRGTLVVARLALLHLFQLAQVHVIVEALQHGASAF